METASEPVAGETSVTATDVCGALDGDANPVQIHLELDRNAPPTGRIRVDEVTGSRAFTGWLDLLRILSQLFADEPLELAPAPHAELAEEVDDVRLDGSSRDE